MSTKQYKILFFILGIITMMLLVYNTGWTELVHNLAGMGYWILPVLVSWLVIYLLNAWAFYDIINEPEKSGKSTGFGKVLQLTITGYAINYITPFVGLGGEPYRIMELKPRLGISKASSSVLQYGLMHMLSHVAFWLFSIVLIVAFLKLDTVLIIGCLILLTSGLLLGYLFMRVYQKGFLIALLSYLEKWPLVGRRAGIALEQHGETLEIVDEQIKTLYSNRKPVFYRALTLEFIARIVGCAEIFFIGQAIQLDMSFLDAVIISSGSSLFANLIFFFPMQLGTREGGMALALASVGLPASPGVFISLVTRIRELFWIGIGYALMYLSEQKPLSNRTTETTELTSKS